MLLPSKEDSRSESHWEHTSGRRVSRDKETGFSEGGTEVAPT